MPWSTPSLAQTRRLVRDNVTAMVAGAAMVPNNVIRVISDANAGLARLTLEYLDWLAKQLLPDTAETEWLDRHGDIWLVNSDGSHGRKMAALAAGSVTVTGVEGSVLPAATQFSGPEGINYETTNEIFLGDDPTPVNVRALTGGTAGNLAEGDTISLLTPVDGIDPSAVVVVLEGGTEQETDDDLRGRVLLRIQEPPMGGCKTDYIEWALAIPGVTRAWCYPLEMGIGTVTVRFMMDDLRADDGGFPNGGDIGHVAALLDIKRPVAVKDFFVVAPIPFPINHTIYGLVEDDEATRGAIKVALEKCFRERTAPGQTWFRAWSEKAVYDAPGVDEFDLEIGTSNPRHINMSDPGYMPILGTITYVA